MRVCVCVCVEVDFVTHTLIFQLFRRDVNRKVKGVYVHGNVGECSQ